jgi:nucleotide-binding universal stress UspA family protein
VELNPKSEIKKTKKMKIVLAIDGSDFSEVAINELKKMTLSSNSEIHIINVYEVPKTTK